MSTFSKVSAQTVFISEFFAENNPSQEEDFVEIAAPTGTLLMNWKIALYDGATGSVYDTHTFLVTDIVGWTDTIANQPYGVILHYAENGIRSQGKNGIALISPSNQVIQFLSYGGVITATDGPASGQNSRDIGPAGETTEYSICETIYDEVSILVDGNFCDRLPSPGKIDLPSPNSFLDCWECDDTGIWSNNKNVTIGAGLPSPSTTLYVGSRKEGVSTGVSIDGGFTGAFTGLSIYAPGTNNLAANFRGNLKITEGNINLYDKFTMSVSGGTFNITPSTNSSNNFKFFEDGKLEVKRLDATQVIYSKEFYVRNPSSFPDYVFANDYDLMPIHDVKAFIEKNKHLPNYPSAADVAKNGIGIAELQIKQMETIEELMLYVIELKEQIEKLKAKVDEIDQNKDK